MEENQWMMTVPTPFSLWSPMWVKLSDSNNAEALTDILETVLSETAVIETVDVELRSHFNTPASEPMFTNPEKSQ
jgi:acetylglutamate synthase